MPLHSDNTNHHQNNTNTPHTNNHTCSAHSQHQVNDIMSDTYAPQHITTTPDDTPDNTNIDSSNYISDSASDSK